MKRKEEEKGKTENHTDKSLRLLDGNINNQNNKDVVGTKQQAEQKAIVHVGSMSFPDCLGPFPL